MSIHPQIIEKDGKKEFVILPYEEFVQIQESLADYEDLRILREEKSSARTESTRSLDDVLTEIQAISEQSHGADSGNAIN